MIFLIATDLFLALASRPETEPPRNVACFPKQKQRRPAVGRSGAMAQVRPCLRQLRVIHKGQKKEIHEGARRTTKGHEGVGESSRGIRQRLGGEKKFPPRALKYLLRGQNDESAKGSQGVGKDSKGVHEGPRRTLRFSRHAHSIIETVSFLCSSVSSCLSCLSCLSMFNDAANRINGTWPLLLIGIRTRCFTLV